jgi:predicted DNA binding CopG/RHH family protein
MEEEIRMNDKLNKYEAGIESTFSQFTQINKTKKNLIEGIIDKANEKKSISIRLNNQDLEQLKLRAELEGLPYQTLLSSIVHKFISDQLVDKRNVLQCIQLLKTT